MEQEAKQLQQEAGLLLDKNMKKTEGRETEYPEATPIIAHTADEGLNEKTTQNSGEPRKARTTEKKVTKHGDW